MMNVNIQYHLSNIGWVGAVLDARGFLVPPYSNRLEAIQITVNDLPSNQRLVMAAHVQDIGWMSETGNGGWIGTTGQDKRLEAFYLKIVDNATGATIPGKTVYTEALTVPYATDGSQCGHTGISFDMRMPAIIIQ